MKILIVFLVGSQALGQVFETTPFLSMLTSFTCHGRPPGYYADLETGCKTYHVCDGNSHFTYVCPKRTLFQQRSRICDHSYLVRCEDSPHFYETESIYSPDEDEEEILVPLGESQESLLSKGFFEEDYNRTEEFFPIETTQLSTEEFTEISITSRPPKAKPETTTLKFRQETTAVNSNQDYASQSTQKFLKFHLKDFRSLFFIPEFENNSIAVKPEREFLLPLEKNDFMKFRNRKKNLGSFSLCPSHCDPKFLLPGFCHPCIMIK